ncbi:MAG: branched-chain amino acid ABC transporter permease [Xanthobacteraceae bacterium]|nr:MAG: branched-chain amino acid ABC transporter permease [Xanthobacteraceae bacterium]
MTTIITILFFAVAYGMILYLISVGLSVTMGLMGFVNLAHGVFAMLGGYVTVMMMNRLGVPFLPALAIGCVLVAMLGFVLERTLYRHLYGRSELDQVLFSIGLVLVSVAIVRIVWGPLAQPMQLPEYLKGQVSIAGITLPAYRLALVGFGTAVIAGLWFMFDRTLFGARIRAAVDNRAMAQSIGINTSRLFSLAFGLGTGLAALGGGLGADVLAIAPAYPLQYIVYFLIVVAVGGLGDIKGPFVAALVIGLADTLCRYFLPEAGSIFIFAFVFLVLLWRPNGIIERR